MKVTQVAWLKGGPCPPPLYGGVERMTAVLCAELARQGHEVTLIAPKGSTVDGVRVIETDSFDSAYQHILDIRPDVVHSHECWSLESVTRRDLQGVPYLATSHVNHSIGNTRNVVYLSYSQRSGHAAQESRDLSQSPVIRVPTDPSLQPLGLPRQDYLLFLGAVQPHKGVTEAAWVAKKLGRKLIVAGPAAGWYAERADGR